MALFAKGKKRIELIDMVSPLPMISLNDIIVSGGEGRNGENIVPLGYRSINN